MTEDTRGIRLRGRAALRTITTVMRCFDCGREPTGSGVGIRRTEDGVVGFAGLVSCGRVWLCPVCNSKIMARRAMELGQLLVWAAGKPDIHLIWGSLTMRHQSGTSLGWMLDVQRDSWRHVVSSKGWRRESATTTVAHSCSPKCDADCDRKRDVIDLGTPGRVGYVRAAELSVGQNGWHPHFHPLLFVRGTKEYAQSIADSVVAAWVAAVQMFGGEAQVEGSQQLKVLDTGSAFDGLVKYITKSQYDPRLAYEVTHSQGKAGRAGRPRATSSHWSLLADVEQGLFEGVFRWEELEAEIHGHRVLMWSRGLRSFAGIGDEVADEDIAAEEVGNRSDTVCFLTVDGWHRMRDDPELLTLVLNALEARGWDACRAVLDAYDVEWFDTVDERMHA